MSDAQLIIAILQRYTLFAVYLITIFPDTGNMLKFTFCPLMLNSIILIVIKYKKCGLQNIKELRKKKKNVQYKIT